MNCGRRNGEYDGACLLQALWVVVVVVVPLRECPGMPCQCYACGRSVASGVATDYCPIGDKEVSETQHQPRSHCAALLNRAYPVFVRCCNLPARSGGGGGGGGGCGAEMIANTANTQLSSEERNKVRKRLPAAESIQSRRGMEKVVVNRVRI